MKAVKWYTLTVEQIKMFFFFSRCRPIWLKMDFEQNYPIPAAYWQYIYRLSFWFYLNFMCSIRSNSADKDHHYELDSLFWPIVFCCSFTVLLRFIWIWSPFHSLYCYSTISLQFFTWYRDWQIVTQLTKLVFSIAYYQCCECAILSRSFIVK